MLRGLVSAAMAAILLSLSVVPSVVAHAALVSASPGPDETVEGSPPELVTRFSQDLDPSRTRLEVRTAAGDRLANGGEPGSNKREFVLPLPELAPGDYQVRWTSFSAEDGELARGSYRFTVTAAPTPSPTPAPTPVTSATPTPSAESTATPPTNVASPSPTPSPTATPDEPSADAGSVVIPIVAAVLIVIVIAARLLRGGRR